MKTLYNIIAALFICHIFSLKVEAQQSTQYTHYMYNQLNLNPAYAGTLPSFEAIAIYREQWARIDGAPTSQSLGLHTPLENERIGVGLNIQNDKLGPARQFYVNANVAYKLPITETGQLSLGVKAGLKYFNLDFSDGNVSDPSDPAFQNNDGRFSPTLGIGAFYYESNWYLGLSVLDLLTDRYYDNSSSNVSDEQLQYFLTAGYVYDINENLKLKPALLAKYLDGFPLVVDISANMLFYEKVSLGLAYRHEDALSILAGFRVFEDFFVSYSYDYTTSRLSNSNTGGSHEFLLRYTMPQPTEVVESQRYF